MCVKVSSYNRVLDSDKIKSTFEFLITFKQSLIIFTESPHVFYDPRGPSKEHGFEVDVDF